MKGTELSDRIAAGAAPTILDVRSNAEFKSGHVPGAVHIPFWKLVIGAPDLPAACNDLDSPIVVYCEHGPRAHVAAAALRRHGFRRVECLEGHMSHWRQAGLPEQK